MRWLSGFILLLIATPVVFISVSNIKAQVLAANILAISREIETAHPPPVHFVKKALAEGEESHATSSCSDEVTRSVVTLWVYLLNSNQGNSPSFVEVGGRALSAVERRIACNPADGNAWLIRAEVLQRLKPDNPEVKASLAMSYRLAPAESWIMNPRFDFALAHFDFVERNLEIEFGTDLQLLAQYAPPDIVAGDYVKANDKVRGMMSEALVPSSEARCKAVAENTDRLGVSLRPQRPCLDGQSLFVGGSEMVSPMVGRQEPCSN